MKIFDTDCVSKVGEKALIARVCEILGDVCPPSPYGSGDDCALIDKKSLSENVYATVDSVIAGRHFDLSTPAELVAEKLLKRNISDIAAMGARPESALSCAIVSDNLSLSWLETFTKSLAETARSYGIKIVGGDFSSAGVDNFFSMSLTLLGSSDLPALLRASADEGEYIYCTGELGYSYLSGKHLTFEPKLRQGQWLAQWNCNGADFAKITSCTDISDGLAFDIENILSRNTKAVISYLPQNQWQGKTSVDESLCGGEDYELLFSLSATESQATEFENAYFEKFSEPVYRIGIVQKKELSEESSLYLNLEGSLSAFTKRGFEHFKKS